MRGEREVEVGAREAIDALAVVRAALESSERRGASVEVEEVIAAARSNAGV
jgi:hypothetical protein